MDLDQQEYDNNSLESSQCDDLFGHILVGCFQTLWEPCVVYFYNSEYECLHILCQFPLGQLLYPIEDYDCINTYERSRVKLNRLAEMGENHNGYDNSHI